MATVIDITIIVNIITIIFANIINVIVIIIINTSNHGTKNQIRLEILVLLAPSVRKSYYSRQNLRDQT